MKSAAGGAVLVILLFVAGAACWSEARVARSVAGAHRRLATLHYDADDGIETTSVWTRLPWPPGTSEDDVRRQRATVTYWRSEYQSLADLTLATGAGALTDSHMLLVAANASFRAGVPEMGDRKTAVSRLDTVMLSYADVLRRDPGATDAAYNYEFVSRMRDALAKAPAGRAGSQEKRSSEKQADVSVDLPAGPTIHGQPGAPPEGTDMSDFKTISPMRFDEREDQMEPGRGTQIRRKG